MANQPIVDIHTHVWRTKEIGRAALGGNRGAEARWFGTPEEHIETMTATGVGYACCMIVTPTGEMRDRAVRERGPFSGDDWYQNTGMGLDQKLLGRMDRNNSWGCSVGQQYPNLLPFIHVDPHLLAGMELRNYVENRVEDGARGVKLLPFMTRNHGNDKRLFDMYEYMEGVGMPLFSQSGGGGGAGNTSPVTGDAWPRAIYFAEVAKTFPRLNIILAHALGGYNGSLADTFHLADNFDNVWFDSTVATPRVGTGDWTPEKTVELFRRVGCEHIMFGTNYPLEQRRESHSDIIEKLPLTEDEKDMIFFKNAMPVITKMVDLPSSTR